MYFCLSLLTGIFTFNNFSAFADDENEGAISLTKGFRCLEPLHNAQVEIETDPDSNLAHVSLRDKYGVKVELYQADCKVNRHDQMIFKCTFRSDSKIKTIESKYSSGFLLGYLVDGYHFSSFGFEQDIEDQYIDDYYCHWL